MEKSKMQKSVLPPKQAKGGLEPDDIFLMNVIVTEGMYEKFGPKLKKCSFLPEFFQLGIDYTQFTIPYIRKQTSADEDEELRSVDVKVSWISDLQNRVLLDCDITGFDYDITDFDYDITDFDYDLTEQAMNDIDLLNENYSEMKVVLEFDYDYFSLEAMHVLSLDQNKRFVFRLDDNHFEEFQNQLKPGEEKVVRFQLTTAQTREYRNDRNLRNEMLSTTYKIRFAKPIIGVNPDGSPKYVSIATNIFPEEASLDELVDAYRDRWNAEESYDYLKNDLMVEQFSGKSFKGILRELYAAWMVFNSTASMAAVIQKTHEELVFENADDQKIILEKLEEYIHELEVDYSAVFKKCTNDFIKMYREKDAIKRGRLLDQAMAKVEKKLLPIMLIRESLKQKVESRRSDNI